MKIRPITPGDNAPVAAIIRRVMTEFHCVGPGFSIEDPEVDAMYEAYQGGRARFYVIEAEGRLAGCGGFAPLTGGTPELCELQKMYFLPSLRGKGRGRALLQHCLTEARQLDFRAMYLETVAHMTAANALYRKFGFRRLAGPMGHTGHGGCDTFYLIEL